MGPVGIWTHDPLDQSDKSHFHGIFASEVHILTDLLSEIEKAISLKIFDRFLFFLVILASVYPLDDKKPHYGL